MLVARKNSDTSKTQDSDNKNAISKAMIFVAFCIKYYFFCNNCTVQTVVYFSFLTPRLITVICMAIVKIPVVYQQSLPAMMRIG